jgi:hypothetical protein
MRTPARLGDLEPRRRQLARPTREGLDARQQFLERERLGHVIVGAGAQRLHLGVHRVLRGEHQHRTLESTRAQRAQHRQPVLSGQPHVEDDQVVRIALAGGPFA